MQRRFIVANLVNIDAVNMTLVYRVKRQRHFRNGQGRILLLLHELHNAFTAFELLTGCFIEVGCELRECREFAILRECQSNAAAEFLNDLRLRGATNTRDRKAGVYCGTETGIEEVGLQEDLSVGD